jgi:molybdopterin molybdotransferase
MLTVAEALGRILDGATPLETEHAPLLDAHRRTLAQDLTARLTQPPFDASAMDGYAVRAADVATLPATLRVIGEAAAGSSFDGHLQPGQAVRIFTGAPVPAGADAIVIQENTRPAAGTVTVHDGSPDPGHIRPSGGDFRHGQTVLNAGRMLDARALTLAAASGHATLPVRRRPVVAILATGDELVPPGQTPGPNQIVSSNPVGLAAIVRAFGGTPVLLGIAPDHQAKLEGLIAGAPEADILVTTGGASVGDHDLVRPALAHLGMALDFWNIAMRPGKPMLFGRLNSQRVLGLPGNPVSALIGARVFLCPLIGALLGAPPADADEMRAVLSVDTPANGPRQHYMRAVLTMRENAVPVVTPAGNQDSSLLAPMAEANALIVRPPNAPAQPAGSTVQVLRLDY